MKKIFVIFTGGTICTTQKGTTLGTDPAAASALIEFYKALPNSYKAEFICGKFFGILSENMTVDKWNVIIDYLKETLPTLSGFDGIIIAHGTDTLAYTSALLALLLKGFQLPVFLVSSNRSIINKDGSPNPLANGVENFAAAVECIERGIGAGVYVPYKNSDNIMHLHKGANLRQCEIYSDDFYSRDMVDLSGGVPSFENTPRTETPLLFELKKPLKDCVLKIDPYVGLNYSRIGLEGVKAVLHTTYHSGTACAAEMGDSSILSLIERCNKAGIPFYFAPAKSGLEQTVYDSVPVIEHYSTHGRKPNFCFGDTTELLYAKLLIEYSQK